jgi:uncharacterized protein YerC
MIRIALPDQEVRQLDTILRTSDDPALRHRVQIVLMAHRGRRHPAIAADTGASARSVQRWLNADLDRDNWTYAEHLYKTRGLRVSPSAMQAFGARHSIRPYRPTDHFLRGDPATQATARDEIAA